MAGLEAAAEPTHRPGASAPSPAASTRPARAPRSGSQRFLDAAFELIDEKGSTEFTIQEVVDRSKQSLRGFYEYFDSKDELVLALFEETVREAGDDIRRAVDAEADPLARLRTLHDPLHEWCDPGETPRKRGSSQPARDLRVLDALGASTTPSGSAPRWRRSRASCSSSSTPRPPRARSTSPTRAGQPRSSSRR